MGDGFRVRVRVRVRAKGWLGFTYYGPKLLKLRLRSGGGFGKKQNRADNHSKSPNGRPLQNILDVDIKFEEIVKSSKVNYSFGKRLKNVFKVQKVCY